MEYAQPALRGAVLQRQKTEPFPLHRVTVLQ